MQNKNLSKLLFLAGALMIIVVGIALLTVQPAKAQCGSQASSCKNCHETQAEKPVNADGTSWHQSHAFGDFCYICHAGNNQATDKTAAHEGMVAPLADVQTSCQQCHVSDLTERAQVYAAVLGVDVGSSITAPTPTEEGEAVTAVAEPAPITESAQSDNTLVVDDPNTVNYAQNYDEIVLGKKPIDWGNSILMVLIGVTVVGGGGFVITHEKLVNISFGETSKAEGEYPTEVVEMLPQIAELKPQARKSLKKVLGNPKKANKVLDLMDAVVSEKEEE